LNLRKHEADLLNTITAFLECAARRKGLEEGMVYAVALADAVRQAKIDGETLSQRIRGGSHSAKEKKRTDKELEEVLRLLRTGRKNIHDRMIDKREEI
jgi:hypothetical protein